MPEEKAVIYERAEWRNRTAVFRDRTHAGEVLAGMLDGLRAEQAIVCAIPAGGVPVAIAVASRLGLPLDVAVVAKIPLPWNSEAGYGAVAFDGTVQLNNDLIAALALGERVVQEGIAHTRQKVEQRLHRLRGARPMPELAHRTVVLVDDGLATGFTLLTAIAALRRAAAAAARLIVAVPTGHAEAVNRVATHVEALYCANVREGKRFAVADAYTDWQEVGEDTATYLLHRYWRERDHDH